MIYKRYRLFGSALCMSLALLATSCSMSDDMECPPDPAGGGTGKAYIQLSFRMADAQGTRANPNGGENGDGNEAGQGYENKIEDAVAFLFNGNETANGAATTLVTPVYFSTVTPNPDDTHYVTETKQADVETGEYNLIVVANPGDHWWETISPLNLHEVRDHIQKTAWKTNTNADGTTTYTDFLMSSAAEPTQKLNLENSSADDPATTTVSVERMAARVDYRAENSYPCTDPTYTGATVEIAGATIINNFNAGSYLLKRVAGYADVNPEGEENVKYLGDETSENTIATNYVIDPWTKLKTAGNADLSLTPFPVDGQGVNAEGLYVAGTYLPTGSDNPEDWSNAVKAGTTVEDPTTNEKWQRVGYTLENTTASLKTAKTYNTGIVFKAKFHPQGVEDYTQGCTFFTYNDIIYPSLTKMVGVLNGHEDDFVQFISDNVSGKTVAEAKAFAETLADDPAGYYDYLHTLADDAQQVYTWTEYLLNVLGVDETDVTNPQINKGGIETRAELYDRSNRIVRTYYNGECYYIWWLRHSNDGYDEKNGVMEYATVRNNIYKVDVKSIYSLGGDIPDSEDIRATVYVNKWVMLGEETLPM